MDKDQELSKISFKNLSFQEKTEYLWDYYKFHLLGILFVLVLTMGGIFYLAEDSKPDILNGYLLNSNWGDDMAQELLADYAFTKGYDLSESNACFNSSVYIDVQIKDQMSSVAYTKVMSDLDMKRTDFYFCNQEIFDYFGEKDTFLELETVLPADLLEKYQNQMISTNQYDENDEIIRTYEAGIDISNTKKMKAYNKKRPMYENSSIIFSIPYNTTRLEHTIEFLRFLDE